MIAFSGWRRLAACTAIALFMAGLGLGLGDEARAQTKKSDFFIDESKLPFEALPGATALWGVHKGAGYQIEVPDDWNGDLVMYAHGFRGNGTELTVDMPRIREFLTARRAEDARSRLTLRPG